MIKHRLAYKSSSKSAKRCLVLCLEARSSELERASESSTCFPCCKSNQVTLFWRELFRVRSRRKVSIITFPVSCKWFKSHAFYALKRRRKSRQQSLFSCFCSSRKYFLTMWWVYRECCLTKKVIQDRLNYLKPKHVKIRSFHLAICSKWERNCLTKLCRTQRNANQEPNF